MQYAIDTGSAEYRDGKRAGLGGYPCNVCPYDNGSNDQSRREWLAGWYVGRHEWEAKA